MTQPWLVSGNMVPDIPGDVLPDHKEFYVIARCIIHKEGHVSDCNVVCSYPGVDEWIVKMILNRRYRPITLRGIPIDVVYPFRYHLEVD